MIDESDHYRKSIFWDRVIFWTLLVFSLSAPVVFVAIGEIWGCFGGYLDFHRSGSVMVAFGATAEIFAVRIFTALNPNGFVDVGFEEFKDKYGALPSRYTFVVLCVVVAGTLISGFGDL